VYNEKKFFYRGKIDNIFKYIKHQNEKKIYTGEISYFTNSLLDTQISLLITL